MEDLWLGVLGKLDWLLGAIPKAKNTNTPQKDFEIDTDASETGWGATDGSNPTWGIWSENDKNYHSNYLELLAIKHAVMIYENIWKGFKHVRIKSDSTTTMSYINSMSGIVSDSCNHLSKTISCYCINRKVCRSAVHIPGRDNETEDYMSRLQKKTLSGDYHQLSFKGFLTFCTVNLILISLHHP